ncbi:leucine-rich repeat-containing protein 23 isoform X2 [Tupaia chinensis]|uniref:leucine-rich repeat-containing protein 23 isoform X2 n=1 Tax=Tupaia chinensis TaxID=246437 RepID=UPI0003C8DAC8|nr:leucine-rich repeat-containing protein 23 isoform X2 [Tupaia chinensis]
MSDEEDPEDFEPDQDDFEKEDDEKETEESEDFRKEGEDGPEEWMSTPLTEDMMKEGLSLLCKTGSGLAHAYVKLELRERDLTDIYLLRSYIHLRYVDVSENHLTDLWPLNHLTHLLWLKADGNRLKSAQLNELPYLQIASFAYNQITDTEGISHPRLGSLDLKGNRIRMVTGLDPQKLNSLHTLELRGNQLESTLGINLPKLKNLYLAQNALKKVEGLENLSNLITLHLRDNQIETLDGFSREMKALQYLNLRCGPPPPPPGPLPAGSRPRSHIPRPQPDPHPLLPDPHPGFPSLPISSPNSSTKTPYLRTQSSWAGPCAGLSEHLVENQRGSLFFFSLFISAFHEQQTENWRL